MSLQDGWVSDTGIADPTLVAQFRPAVSIRVVGDVGREVKAPRPPAPPPCATARDGTVVASVTRKNKGVERGKRRVARRGRSQQEAAPVYPPVKVAADARQAQGRRPGKLALPKKVEKVKDTCAITANVTDAAGDASTSHINYRVR